jgi:hypothetical protein
MLTRKSLITILTLAALFVSLTPSVAGARSLGTFASPLPGVLSARLDMTDVTSGAAEVGSEFTADVLLTISLTGAGLTAAEVYLGYDPAMVEWVDIEPLPEFFGAPPTVDEAEALVPCPTGDADACVHLVLAGPGQTDSSGGVARLHWLGLAQGDAGFTVLRPVTEDLPEPAAPHTAFVNADGAIIPFDSDGVTTSVIVIDIGATPTPSPTPTPTPTGTPTPSPTPSGGHIAGVVNRQGQPSGPGTLGCSSVLASNATDTVGPVYTFFGGPYPPNTPPEAQHPGGFWPEIDPPGTYDVTASYSGYLSTEKTGVVVSDTGTPNLGSVTLRGGDVNGDDAINIQDVAMIIGKFGQTGVDVQSDTFDCNDPDEAADINDDGIVNIKDLAITVGNFGSVGPTLWQ